MCQQRWLGCALLATVSLMSISRFVQILRALSSRLPLKEGVDLGAIAAACDGFSGADLGALLSDAQLAAVHEVLAQPQDTSQVSSQPHLYLHLMP